MSQVIALSDSKISTTKEVAGISISNSSDTSKAELMYADQLQREYLELLHSPLARVDASVAGRFHSLIHELAFMVERTEKNVEAGR